MEYQVLQNGAEHGPYTWPQLLELQAQGAVAGTDQVRRVGSEEWLPLDALQPAVTPAPDTAAEPPHVITYGYSRPGYAEDASPLPAAHTYRLFDSGAVAIATFMGTPIAGSIVVALNYRRLGKRATAVKAVVCGVVATVLAMVIASLLPQGLSTGFGLALLFSTSYMANVFQGTAIAEHKRQGGKIASRWYAFLIGLGIMALMVCVVVALAIIEGLVAEPGPQ
ncbi:MAG: hypothetical protein K0Q72_1871 [Armatimonadetes bacterium]|nr:hypothetical protein [Armatimonadota bacterium]